MSIRGGITSSCRFLIKEANQTTSELKLIKTRLGQAREKKKRAEKKIGIQKIKIGELKQSQGQGGQDSLDVGGEQKERGNHPPAETGRGRGIGLASGGLPIEAIGFHP